MPLTEYQEAFNHSLKLLSIRKRTVKQLYHKLVEKGFGCESVDSVIEELKKRKFLDDEEFARTYVSFRLSEGSAGRLKYRQTLLSKGIDSEIVEKTLADVDPDYERTAASELARQKAEYYRQLEPLARKKKIYDFLIRKGFRPSVCREAINGLV